MLAYRLTGCLSDVSYLVLLTLAENHTCTLLMGQRLRNTACVAASSDMAHSCPWQSLYVTQRCSPAKTHKHVTYVSNRAVNLAYPVPVAHPFGQLPCKDCWLPSLQVINVKTASAVLGVLLTHLECQTGHVKWLMDSLKPLQPTGGACFSTGCCLLQGG